MLVVHQDLEMSLLGTNHSNMSREVTYSLPLFLETGKVKKRKNYMNLNQYRNWPFHQSNDLKKAMKEIVKEECPPFRFEKFSLVYTLYLMDNRLRDISNVCSVIDKFQCDAIVELGYVPDDNYTHLEKVTYQFGGVDKTNPRCEVQVIEEK